jgi:hypothetical protein
MAVPGRTAARYGALVVESSGAGPGEARTGARYDLLPALRTARIHARLPAGTPLAAAAAACFLARRGSWYAVFPPRQLDTRY